MSLRTQGTTLFSAILALVATTVILQLWLLTFSMEALLRGLLARGLAIVLVTHDPAQAARLAHRRFELSDGRLVGADA